MLNFPAFFCFFLVSPPGRDVEDADGQASFRGGVHDESVAEESVAGSFVFELSCLFSVILISAEEAWS